MSDPTLLRQPPLIVLTAGGTGGHVFPAEALAAELLERGLRLALVTDDRGNRWGGTLGSLETYPVAASQMLGRGILGKLKGVFTLTRGTMQAKALFKRLRPAAVVGFGGYASVPAVAAAVTGGLPVLLHEQNAVLGRANRLFAGKVSRIATSYEQVAALPAGAATVRTGMPVRPAIRALADAPYAPPAGDGPVRVLVLGGSQGARVFTDVLPAAFAALPEVLRARLDIAQQARPEDVERARAAYAAAGLRAIVQSFFDDVPERLAACHLLIGRSGASTVAEVTVARRPSVLVPYPFAADDHQTANARAVAAAGAGWLVGQEGFDAAAVAALLADLLAAPERLAKAAEAAHTFALPDAAARLADAVLDLLPVVEPVQ
ncbi:undecaprenyldiphospho-muramoylpentapeptide beta-N-acetylglucosaminyltransferase [Novispirillum sp. DQ9]|uniref:undecaprenyldiphospho-muramoylpentapeptide beta-N-acetylglucosaminyltransferase n=1 Tax=Novispirillum sp. DQ9 TaxID=3398612 RepID=UPI003C7ADBEF